MNTRPGLGRALGAALLTVALAPFAAFATGACGGKVLAEAGGDAGPGDTATGSSTATGGPTSTSTGSTTGTTSATATTTTYPTTTATTTATTNPVCGTVGLLDGGVCNDGEPGSLVAIAKTACTIPSAVTALEDTEPVTVGRVEANCQDGLRTLQCPSNDGLQCIDPLLPTLLFDQTCIDWCTAGEYVFVVNEPDAPVKVPPGCRMPSEAKGYPLYCCPCGAN